MSQITLRDIDERLQYLEDRIVKRIDDHEMRIRENESFRYRILGISATISLVAGSMVSYFMARLNK